MTNWNDLRIFLALARNGQMLSAARKLGITHTTVARRISLLEESMRIRLVDRSPRGVTLTAAGAALVAHAERMEAEMFAASTELGESESHASGVVRLTTPEAFGTYLIAPHINRLYERHPNLRLELLPESRSVNLNKREADLAVGLSRPIQARIVARRLTDYRLGLYTSVAYLKKHGPVTDIAELSDHPFVWYVDELIEMPELRYLDQLVAHANTAFRSSSVAAQHNAIAAGFGIGILHRFAASQDPRLVAVLPDQVEASRAYWLWVHADQKRLPRIRAVIEFLDEIIKLKQISF
jgi:DNA-binding transcriptional LysR family regulator